MIYVHGYGDSKYAMMGNAEAQAKFGYYTFCYSVRGQGKSTGLSNLISRTEMKDLFEIVDYIKKDSLADSAHIGICGASQGGILPFMAACNGLNVTMVMSDLASPEFASSWIENGSIKITAFFTVDYDTSVVRYTPEVIKMRNWMLSKNRKAWDSLYNTMPRNRDFILDVPNNKVPVLLSNGWQDKFFNSSGVLKAVGLMKSPCVLYCGAMDGHGVDSAAEENAFISFLDNAWMGFYMKNTTGALFDTTKFFFAASHFPSAGHLWSFSRYQTQAFSKIPRQDIKLYLHSDHTLSNSAGAGAKSFVVLNNDVRDKSLQMLTGIMEKFAGNNFDKKFIKHEIVFDSEPLNSGLMFAGTPSIVLYYSSDKPVCQYNFQIWEVTPQNEAKLVTRINYTDRNNKPGKINNSTINGLSHAHEFKAGNRIRIVVTNLDTSPNDDFLSTNPYVLPVLTKSKNTIFMNDVYPSHVILPVINIPSGSRAQ